MWEWCFKFFDFVYGIFSSESFGSESFGSDSTLLWNETFLLF